MPRHNINLTDAEQAVCDRIAERVTSLRTFLFANELDSEAVPDRWYRYLNEIKKILGNFNNDVSFIATLLAKSYLTARFESLELDAAGKPQGAPGLDIDLTTEDVERIIGEIKTTIPGRAG